MLVVLLKRRSVVNAALEPLALPIARTGVSKNHPHCLYDSVIITTEARDNLPLDTIPLNPILITVIVIVILSISIHIQLMLLIPLLALLIMVVYSMKPSIHRHIFKVLHTTCMFT